MPCLHERFGDLQATEFGAARAHARNDLQHGQRLGHVRPIPSFARSGTVCRGAGFYKVQDSRTANLVVGNGAQARTIAYRARSSSARNAAACSGYPDFMSDMASTKAAALADWPAEHGFGIDAL